MKYCRRCGLRVEDTTTLCPKCGGMDFISEEEKARMSNGQSAPNRRPAQNPGIGANRPVRPNNTHSARPMQGQGQQRPMQGQGQQRPMQGQGQGQQRPMQGQEQQKQMTMQEYGQDSKDNAYTQNEFDNDTMSEQDIFSAEMPETIEESKKKRKREKVPKQPKQPKGPADPSVVTMKDWLILWFKLIIPIFNLVCIVQIITDKNEKYNESIKNYVKAYLIMLVISLIAGFASSFVITSLIASVL